MTAGTERRVAPLVGAAVLLVTLLALTDDEPKPPQPAQVVGITDSPTSKHTFEYHRSIYMPTEA